MNASSGSLAPVHELLALRPVGGFSLIMADPPWRFVHRSSKGYAKSAQAHYACQSLDWIRSLPIGAIAAKDSVLWLWGTWPLFEQTYRVARAWGFTPKTGGSWVKWNPDTQKLGFGTGYLLRCSEEPFLIATRGRPRTSRSVRNTIMGRRREHSRKPEEAYQAAEQLVPDGPRLDLFARQGRPGWSAWGDETEKFTPAACSAGASA